jgi:hypothetical protein
LWELSFPFLAQDLSLGRSDNQFGASGILLQLIAFLLLILKITISSLDWGIGYTA